MQRDKGGAEDGKPETEDSSSFQVTVKHAHIHLSIKVCKLVHIEQVCKQVT